MLFPFPLQVTYPGADAASALPTYSFCRQISAQEFEEQKLTISQAAIAELLESVIKNKTMSVKEKKKKLAQVRFNEKHIKGVNSI